MQSAEPIAERCAFMHFPLRPALSRLNEKEVAASGSHIDGDILRVLTPSMARREGWERVGKAAQRAIPQLTFPLANRANRPYPSSQPLRDSRVRYLFAPGRFAIFPAAASQCRRLPPSRNDTAPRLNASEIGPANRKSP